MSQIKNKFKIIQTIFFIGIINLLTSCNSSDKNKYSKKIEIYRDSITQITNQMEKIYKENDLKINKINSDSIIKIMSEKNTDHLVSIRMGGNMLKTILDGDEFMNISINHGDSEKTKIDTKIQEQKERLEIVTEAFKSMKNRFEIAKELSKELEQYTEY